MTDDLQLARAKRYGREGFAEYLEAKAVLRPTPPARAAEVTAERVECAATRGDERCIRAAGHTGPHQGPPAARVAALPPDPALDQIRAEVAHEQEATA